MSAMRVDDGLPDLLWCCLHCGRIICRGCLAAHEEVGSERRCVCGEVITQNQRIDNNTTMDW